MWYDCLESSQINDGLSETAACAGAVVYNYKADKPVQHFPPMHNFRNAVRFLYRGETVLELFSKYGIVEHETVPIAGDLYMSFSNCPQALSTENGTAWIEDGRPVEQGKEALQWAKLPLNQALF